MLQVHEKERLANLHAYNVLDTDPEAPFDAVTGFMKDFCQIPICLVSLVDEHRQWFKSKQGLDVCETHRDYAFCDHAIRQDGIMEIQDATQDARFADNPLVTGDPKIRFYAGAPLQTPEGFNIGTLCVIDYQPRQLKPLERQALQCMAPRVVDLLAHRKRELERSRQLEKLEQFIRRHAKDSLGDFAHDALHLICEEMGVLRGVFYAQSPEVDHEGQRTLYEAQATYGTRLQDLPERRFGIGESVLGEAVRQGSLRHIHPIDGKPRPMEAGASALHPQALVLLPLENNNDVTGLLALESLHPFSDDSLQTLRVLARDLGATLQGLLSNERMKRFVQKQQQQAAEPMAYERKAG